MFLAALHTCMALFWKSQLSSSKIFRFELSSSLKCPICDATQESVDLARLLAGWLTAFALLLPALVFSGANSIIVYVRRLVLSATISVSIHTADSMIQVQLHFSCFLLIDYVTKPPTDNLWICGVPNKVFFHYRFSLYYFHAPWAFGPYMLLVRTIEWSHNVYVGLEFIIYRSFLLKCRLMTNTFSNWIKNSHFILVVWLNQPDA